MHSETCPLITVAMPAYNAGKFLRPAVMSILAQTYPNWELLILDDKSTDASLESIADIQDQRVRILHGDFNQGIAVRLNQAIDLAQGQFFARMDADDISHPERFALQMKALAADPSLDLIGTRCATISEGNEVLGVLPGAEDHGSICSRPWLGFYLPHPSWMGRTKWFQEHRYASPGPYCCEDQEMLLRTHATSRFHVLPSLLLAYRLRAHMSWKKAWRTRLTLYRVQLRYFLECKNYSFATLATMAFFARFGLDVLRVFRQFVFKQGGATPVSTQMSKEDIESWRCWIVHLESRQGLL
jgi:glycosyltransferase involved in cell wall biosynthesis